MSLRPSRRWAAALTASAALLLAACSSPAAEPTASDAASPAASESGEPAAFPVTITHALGEAVIEAKPERVVTLGWGADDIALELGTVPVGVEEDTWSGDADKLRPWSRAVIEEQGAELPTTIQMYPELDVDAIVALEPDLVLAPQSGLDQAMFDQLTQIVPVVAHPGEAWGTAVEDQIRLAAQALGVPDQGEELIAKREATLEQARTDHPEIVGKTFAYIYAGEPGSLYVYPPNDSRVALLTSLGLEVAPEVAALKAPEGEFVASIGLENVDVLDDVDVLFTWFNSEEEQKATEEQELFQRIPAFQRGSYAPMLDRQIGMAVSVATPLSIPWALDKYLPLIVDAVAKVS